MATKPPKRKSYAQQYAAGTLPQRTSVGDTRIQYKIPTVRATAPKAQATFQPQKNTFQFNQPIRPGVAPKNNPKAYQTGPGQMPIQYNPNADLGTVQGAIDAGYMQWNQGLGKLGYKPPPRAPSEIGIAGYHPPGMDISGDWEYQAALGDIAASDAADAAAAGENINALAVNWGGDLSELVKGGLIQQGAADAAKVNQFSQMAELQRSLEQGGGRLENQLAARGGLDTGALVGGNAQLNREFQQQSVQGLQELMSQIRSIRSSQAQGAAERRGSLAGVRSSVASRLSADPRYQPIPDMQAFWDPSVGAYVDDWGRRYDVNKKRLS